MKSPISKDQNIFSTKIIEKISPNVKKEMPINMQEAYRTSIKLDQEIKSFCHIIIKTQNLQNEREA